MKVPSRISFLFFIGVFAAGSTALGYYYFFFYEPPLKAAAQFLDDLERKNAEGLKTDIFVSNDIDEGQFRDPSPQEIESLMTFRFQRGRILDQRRLEGRTRDLYYLVYREPDGRVYALIAAEIGRKFRIVIPEHPSSRRQPYLWDYSWTN